MIRGLFHNAVVIDNPNGGKVFRQAIFLLRPEAEKDKAALAAEAQKIIEESTGTKKRRRTYR